MQVGRQHFLYSRTLIWVSYLQSQRLVGQFLVILASSVMWCFILILEEIRIRLDVQNCNQNMNLMLCQNVMIIEQNYACLYSPLSKIQLLPFIQISLFDNELCFHICLRCLGLPCNNLNVFKTNLKTKITISTLFPSRAYKMQCQLNDKQVKRMIIHT